MEENQVKKNNSKGLYAIIVILSIAVIGMGLFIMYDKGVIFSKTTSITKNDNNVINNNEKETTEQIVNKLSEEEAMKIGQELWNYAYHTYWGGEPTWSKHLSETPNEYGAKYYICDTTVDEVKAKYTSDFKSEFCYSDGSTCYDYKIDEFINTNDGYQPCDGAQRGGIQTYKETTLTVSDIQSDKIVFTANSAYCSTSFCRESKDTEKEIKKDFIIKKVNDSWLISYFYLPN